MGQLSYEIDFGGGFETAQPRNWKDARLEAIFTNASPSATIQSISFEFVGEVAKKINGYCAKGLAGGYGMLEGLPLKISLGTTEVFNGVLDLPNASSLYECDIVKIPLKQNKKIDWLNDTAHSFSFAYLKSIGAITPSDYKKTPFLVTSLPDMPQLTMLFLEEFTLIYQVAKEIENLSILIGQLAGDAGSTAGTLGGDTGILIATIAEIVLEIIYIGTLLLGILFTTEQILDQIVQTKRYKYCMRVEDLMKKACQFLGITFSSTILDSSSPYHNLTIMPKKMVIPPSGGFKYTPLGRLFSNPTGPIWADIRGDEQANANAYGYFDGTFKKLLNDFDQVFNSKPVFFNNKLTEEEVHFYNVLSGFVMPNEGDQGYTYNYPAPYGINASELASTYELRWMLDSSDENTIHRYEGTTCEVLIQPNTIGQSGNLLLPGLTQDEMPFSLAKRKDYLNIAEQAVNSLLGNIADILNSMSGVFNAIASKVNDAINTFGVGNSSAIPTIPTIVLPSLKVGYLELSGITFENQKMFIGTDSGGDWLIHPDNQKLLAASTIMQTFHGKNLLSRGNQWKLYKGKKCKMCANEFLSLIDNNVFTTPDAKIGKFDKLIWNPHNDMADSIDYRVNEKWTNNYNETIIIDGN